MTSELLQIKQAAEEYDRDHHEERLKFNSNARLKALVEVHGIDKVAAASGLKPETLILYTTRKTPPTASTYAVEKAEHVLNNL